MKTVPPTNADGIERYLGSGLVKAIGPVLTKKLVGRLRSAPDVIYGIHFQEAECVVGSGSF